MTERQDAALAQWADKITGLADKKLGAHFDTSCTDPSRLFFPPRHPQGAEFRSVIIECCHPCRRGQCWHRLQGELLL